MVCILLDVGFVQPVKSLSMLGISEVCNASPGVAFALKRLNSFGNEQNKKRLPSL